MIPVERRGGMLIVGGQELTADEGDALAEAIRAQVAEVRRDTGRVACAQAGGHDWNGYDGWTDRHRGKPVRIEWCQRPHCDTERTLDGWGQR